MIPINKRPEPHQLIEYRKLPNASYRDMHGAHLHNMQMDVYSIVLNSLLEEQGYICAYCMQRITDIHGGATIEHIIPQSIDSTKALAYRNMLAVCNGNRTVHDDKMKTCDAHRGNAYLTVNPLHAETLSSIRYQSNGHIYSADESINRDLNEVLNLNCMQRRLPENRKSALDSYRARIIREYSTGDFAAYCEKELTRIQSMRYKLEYVGVIEDWLKRHC